MCKRIFKFELQLISYWQNIKFSRNCPKFHIFTKFVIFQVYLQLVRPTASSVSILWQGHVRNTLFHFWQLWAIKFIGTHFYHNQNKIFNFLFFFFLSFFFCSFFSFLFFFFFAFLQVPLGVCGIFRPLYRGVPVNWFKDLYHLCYCIIILHILRVGK